MNNSARCKVLDLGDEFGCNTVLRELVVYLSESDCADFMDHVNRMWDLNSYDENEEDENDDE